MPECSPEFFRVCTCRRTGGGCWIAGGLITSDAGALLLGATVRAIGLVDRFDECFIDRSDPKRIEHRLRRWSGRELRWAMRTSTITTHCVMIR
jgi:hypothetical protein